MLVCWFRCSCGPGHVWARGDVGLVPGLPPRDMCGLYAAPQCNPATHDTMAISSGLITKTESQAKVKVIQQPVKCSVLLF